MFHDISETVFTMDLEPAMDPGARLGVLPALADDHRHFAPREPQDEVTSAGRLGGLEYTLW
jgi:hypothetical protein